MLPISEVRILVFRKVRKLPFGHPAIHAEFLKGSFLVRTTSRRSMEVLPGTKLKDKGSKELKVGDTTKKSSFPKFLSSDTRKVPSKMNTSEIKKEKMDKVNMTLPDQEEGYSTI